MVPFSLVWRLPVAAVLLLTTLIGLADDNGVAAVPSPAAAPAAAPSPTPSSAANPASATSAVQPMTVTPANGAGGQAAPGAVEPATAGSAKIPEKAAPPAEQKSGADAAASISPNLPGAEAVPTEGENMMTGMSAKTGFGYDVLGGKSSLITDGPIDDTYPITPGDEIVVSIWGELTETLNLVVSKEGYIDLPQGGGRITTNGMTLGELRPQIMRALGQIYAAFINAVEPSKSTAFVDIRLGKLNDLTIFVLGEVQTPGNYRITPGAANVINLINNAGGVRNAGSLRAVQIRRSNGQVDTVDLYRFFLTGDLDLKLIRVRQGDHIVVPLKRKSVTIQGEVLRPHNYELVGEEGLRELVELAGGFKPDAYAKQVQLRRFELNKGEVLVDIDLDEVMRDPTKNVALMNGDSISVTKNVQVRKNSVSIKGDGITRAGTYEWTPGMTLGDLISKADGLREYAYLDRADLIRTEDDFSKKLMVIRLADFYKRDEHGDFVFSGTLEQNLPLREMDEIIIQSLYGMSGKDPHVSMQGHVKEPGHFVLARDMTLYDLIFARGGFQDEGFRKSTFLDTAHIFRRVPGEVGKKIISFNLGALLNNDPEVNQPLQEEDIIHIYSAAEMGNRLEVSIDGLVNKTGQYPMSEELTLEDLLVLAGGLKPGYENMQAVIARADAQGNSRSIVVPVDTKFYALPKERRTQLESKDKISIVGLDAVDRYVSLEGQVKAPGKFIFTKDMKLKDLIDTRGGFQDAAFRRSVFPDMGHIFRKVPGEIGKKIIPFKVGALIKGDSSANMALEEGDVVRIYSYDEMRTEQKVSIDGLVKQPGSFPIAEGMTLEDLIVMAGGILPDAFKVEATIARSERSDKSGAASTGDPISTLHIPVDIKNYMNLAPAQRTPLKPDDRVTLRAAEGDERTASVQVDGEVLEPGHYSLVQKNELLSSLIRRAGGLKETALPEGATILRRKTGPRSLGGDKPEEVYRVPVNVRAALNEPGGADDIVVLRDDRVYIPANPGVVEVRGAVRRELTLKHKSGRSVAEYIDLCGGYLDKADPANVRVFSANQTALPLKLANKSRSGRAVAGVQEIPPGSIIEVPFIRATERLQTVEVKGAVNNPISLQYIEGAPLGYYLNLSGGFSADADLENISVLLPDGGLLVKTGNQPFNPVIPGGSQIMVTRKTLAPAQ